MGDLLKDIEALPGYKALEAHKKLPYAFEVEERNRLEDDRIKSLEKVIEEHEQIEKSKILSKQVPPKLKRKQRRERKKQNHSIHIEGKYDESFSPE